MVPPSVVPAPIPASGPAPSAQFDRANALYDSQQYTAAAAAYEEIARAGKASAALYFNLGNAWFKAGQMGRAIAAYRRASELDPRDDDTRANLDFARNQAGAGAPALPGSAWTRWVERLTLDEWTKLASLFCGFFFLTLTARQIWPAWRKPASTVAAALGAACLVWLACLGLALDARYGAQGSVVIVPEAVAHNGPLDVSPSAFVAHDGAELLVLDSKDGWLESPTPPSTKAGSPKKTSPWRRSLHMGYGFLLKAPKPDPKVIAHGITFELDRREVSWSWTYKGIEFSCENTCFTLPTPQELDSILQQISSLEGEMKMRLAEGLKEWCRDKPAIDVGEDYTVYLDKLGQGEFELQWSGGETWADMGVFMTVKDGAIVDIVWVD